MKSTEVLEEWFGKLLQGPQVFDCLLVERKRFEITQDMLESASNQIVSLGRQPADEQIEDGSFIHCCVEIRLQHGQFIKVGQQCGVGIVCPGRVHHCSRMAPASRTSCSAWRPSSGRTLTARVPSTMT